MIKILVEIAKIIPTCRMAIDKLGGEINRVVSVLYERHDVGGLQANGAGQRCDHDKYNFRGRDQVRLG